MQERNGAEVIVDHLIGQKVPHLIGVCGHGDVGLMDAAYDRQDRISTISVHHEQTAGFMADTYYRVSGQPLATFTSVGPGSVSIQVAIANAMFDSSAVLAITGNVPTQQFNRGPFQEFGHHYQADFVSSMRPYVKRSFQATRAEMLPDMMRHAWSTMLSGRVGPVHLDVPLNVFNEKTDAKAGFTEDWRTNVSYRSGPDPAALQAAAELLLGAQRPLILAGNGCLTSRIGDDLLELSALTGIPIATTPQAKGVIDETHPVCLGPIGRDGVYPANRASRGCDVLLALGTRFGDRSSSSWRDGVTHQIPPQKLIHVDQDPAQLGRNYPPAVGITASAGIVVRQLIELFKGRMEAVNRARTSRAAWTDSWSGWKQRWDADLAKTASREDVPIHPDRVISELTRSLPDNSIVVSDIGMNHTWVVQQWKVRRGGTLLQSGGLAAMGMGVCGSLGAKLAAPERPVVAVVGDGGFMMHNNAVATAVEYGLPVVWLVWNNCGYVSIRDLQKGFYGREFATRFRIEKTGELHSADHAMIARGMGADGVRVERPSDIGQALQAAIASGLPTVLDVQVEANVSRHTAGVLDFPPLMGSAPNYDPDPLR
ncbi:MAG: thiamine pyrophosphate-binding protein [Rubrivivax sp.]|nr:thiamine pyrophosphate-binding protein [Rubrivivax sp.]